MSYQHLIFEVADGVATLTLNRPNALNALRVEMLAEMNDALDRVRNDGEARTLLIAGAGKAFCSGADLVAGTGAAENSGQYDAGRILETHINPLIEKLVALPVPIVAAVQGAVAGAGCSIALAADIVISARSAFFLMAFTKVGLIPDGGASWVLPRLVGRARANAMLFIGDRIPAETALDWGMIYQVIDDVDLMPTAKTLAGRLACGPTRAYGFLRQAMDRASSSSLSDALQLERALQRETGLTSDFEEGKAAFREKRSPKFHGK